MSTIAPTYKAPPAVVGMILFITSEVMFFGGLFTAYFSLRAGEEVWPPDGSVVPGLLLPGLFTAVLVASSVTQHRAAAALDTSVARRWLAITIAFGAVFLGGQAWEWNQLSRDGLSIASSSFGTSFFTLTGAHGLHVIGGLVMLAGAWLRLGRGGAGPDRRGLLHAVTYYWHFVDAVWLIVFTALYLPI